MEQSIVYTADGGIPLILGLLKQMINTPTFLQEGLSALAMFFWSPAFFNTHADIMHIYAPTRGSS